MKDIRTNRTYKVVGNGCTHLTLTDKAQECRAMSDPIEIREYCVETPIEDQDGNVIDIQKDYTYDIVGILEIYDLEGKDVNKILEDFYDDLQWFIKQTARVEEEEPDLIEVDDLSVNDWMEVN